MRKNHAALVVGAAIVVIALAAAIPIAIPTMAEDSPVPTRAEQPDVSAPAAPEVPPAVVILKSHHLEGILGKEVRSATGENMGRIVDVVVDPSGQVRAAVIDFGGFLGVGSRKIAVDWSALSFPPANDQAGRVTLEFTRDQVKAGPEVQAGKPVVVLGAQGKLEPYPFQ
jgi:sporulation protein YlmC with PRC-barrel domain